MTLASIYSLFSSSVSSFGSSNSGMASAFKWSPKLSSSSSGSIYFSSSSSLGSAVAEIICPPSPIGVAEEASPSPFVSS
jgi:hypothetical protein